MNRVKLDGILNRGVHTIALQFYKMFGSVEGLGRKDWIGLDQSEYFLDLTMTNMFINCMHGL